MTDGYMAIRELSETLGSLGVDRLWLADMEVSMVNKLSRAIKEARAMQMMPLIGSKATADELGISRATVYNIYNRRVRGIAA